MKSDELKLQTKALNTEIAAGLTWVESANGKRQAALRHAKKAHDSASRRLKVLQQHLPANETVRLRARLAALEQAITAAHSEKDTASVEYLGTPYAGARKIDGIWYFKGVDGKYHRFVFQDKVRRLK
jgi:hypothetical protein